MDDQEMLSYTTQITPSFEASEARFIPDPLIRTCHAQDRSWYLLMMRACDAPGTIDMHNVIHTRVYECTLAVVHLKYAKKVQP